jgi:Uma2 family endonuclease
MPAEVVAGRDTLIRRWAELGQDPNSPDYYELNEFGEIIMSPRPTNDHQRVIQAVVSGIAGQLGPEAVAEISVMTDRGIRVPDVVWMPREKWARVKGTTPLPFAPDLCVEVLSPGNTAEEIAMKTGAYLRGGASEVVVVGLSGQVQYYGPDGPRNISALGLALNLEPDLF